jgi:hypothetical protein
MTFRALVAGGFYSADPEDRSTPRAIRCNNPGALNTADWTRAWAGFAGEQLDRVGNNTAIFEAPEFGVGAWWELMRKYRARKGEAAFTLAYILRNYSGGNMDTASDYIAFVSAQSGVSALSAIDLDNFTDLLPVAKGFFHYEAGQPTPLGDEQILFGFALGQAGGAVPSAPVAPVAPVYGISGGRHARLLAIARAEAEKQLSWSSRDSEAEKYLAALRPILLQLGHITPDTGFFNWCASFATWCCRHAGYAIPDQPPGFWASMALVESWRAWGQSQGILGTVASLADVAPADVLLYEWFDGDAQLDHIGICAGPSGDAGILAYEGNADNRTAVKRRDIGNVKYRLRLPD